MNQESLKIILRTYSKGGFNEDEAVQLIEDLYDKTIVNSYPWINPLLQPQVTYTQPEIKELKVTCKTD
jgi:hypothetical protein